MYFFAYNDLGQDPNRKQHQKRPDSILRINVYSLCEEIISISSQFLISFIALQFPELWNYDHKSLVPNGIDIRKAPGGAGRGTKGAD